jgi:hypothetical protein
MPNLNPNSTNYRHTYEPNTNDLTMAMDYTEDGKPAIRVLSNIQGDITIEGDVTIPGEVTVVNNDDDPLYTHTHLHDENDVEYSAANPLTIDGTVTVNQPVAVTDNNGSLTVDGSVSVSNFPATQAVTGTFWQATQPVSGTVTVQDGGGSITVDGTVLATVSGTVELGTTTLAALENTTVTISGTPTVNIGTMPEVEIKNDVGNPIPVVGTVNIGSNGLVFGDSANNTAFGRLRTANTRLLGEFRNQYGTMGPVEIVTKFETGGTQTVNLAEANTLINVTTTAGSRAVRQSRKYHPYIPGTTNLTFVTFTMGTAKTNLQQMAGLFDDLNGIFFRMNGSTPEMVIRKGGVDTEIAAQSSWNVDRLDGTGASGINIDFTKSQIFVVDYQWLGVGRVRVGFSINGRVYYTHYFTHLNELTGPYMFQPSLPVRWEIKNTGTTESVSSMMCICYSVYVEGSDFETGFDNSVSNGTTAVTLGANADSVKGILAIRLKNTINGQPNRAVARVKDWELVSSLTAQYKVMILQGIADLAGTPVWTNATPTGWCEYTTDFRLANPPSPANAVVLFDGYAVGTVGNRPQRSGFASDNRSSAIYQNYDSTDSMILAIVAYRIPNDNSVMRAALNWVETK